MGRPAKTKSENNTNETTVEDVVETKETITVEKTQLEELFSTLTDLKSEIDELKAEKSVNKDVKEPKDKDGEMSERAILTKMFQDSEKDKTMVTLCFMGQGGATLRANEATMPIRFDRFGDIEMYPYKDLALLKNKYSYLFNNLTVRIISPDDAIDKAGLRQKYNSFDISTEELEGLFALDDQEMVKKVKELPENLQESFLGLVIEQVARGNKDFSDGQKWMILQSAFGVDISDYAKNYVVD